MSDEKRRDLAKRVLKARLVYLHKHTRRMPLAALLLSLSLIVLALLKWIIIVPYIDKLLTLAHTGDETRIVEELGKMPILVRFSPLIIAVSMSILTIAMGLLALTFHRVSKIRYMSFLDSARLFLFFATIMCSLSAILWANLGSAFISNDTKKIESLIGPIWFSEKILILGFVAGSVALSIAYYQMSRISNIIYGTNRNIYIAFVILNILSLFDIILTLPFYLYVCWYKKREVFAIAYMDIAKYVLEK